MNEEKQTYTCEHREEFADERPSPWRYVWAFADTLTGNNGTTFARQIQVQSEFFMGGQEERRKTSFIFREGPEVVLKAAQIHESNQ